MLRPLRENGPALLVPLAWTFVTAAHLDLVGPHPLFVAHVVMCVLLFAFALLSWSEMRTGVLLAWRRVIVAGFGLTALGTVGLVATVEVLLWITVVGWMLLPAAGFVYTARRVERRPRAYGAGAVLSVLGAAAYVLAPVVGDAGLLLGLALVNVGQTAGIVAAVLDY